MMKEIKPYPRLWTKERIIEESKKYSNKREFEKGTSAAYSAANKYYPGLLSELFENLVKPSGYWNEELLKEEMRKYSSKSEFKKCSSAAYDAALRRHKYLLDEAFKNKYKSWDEESIRKEAKKYAGKVEFQKGSRSAYQIAIVKYPGLVDEFFKNKAKPSGYWTKSLCEKEAKKYSNKSEFQKKSSSAYQTMIRKYPGLIDEFFENKRRPEGYWVEDNIRKEASKYSNKNKFRIGNASAYAIAYKKYPGLLNELFENTYRNWDEKKLIEEARKYSTKAEFSKGNPSAYAITITRFKGLISELFINQYSYGERSYVYLWGDADGSDIYKIGLTSKHIQHNRILKVAKLAQIRPEIIRICKVDNAAKLEKELLKIGRQIDLGDKFDGYTEFRRFTVQELKLVISIIDNATIQEVKEAA